MEVEQVFIENNMVKDGTFEFYLKIYSSSSNFTLFLIPNNEFFKNDFLKVILIN